MGIKKISFLEDSWSKLFEVTKNNTVKQMRVRIPEFLPCAPQNCIQKLGPLKKDIIISVTTKKNPRIAISLVSRV